MIAVSYIKTALPALILLTGCAPAPRGQVTIGRPELKRRALELIKAGIRYEHNAAVRVGAVQALESYGAPEVLPWIRTALLDDQPAVRFAGCVALGELGDASAESALRGLVNDVDAGVQVAALFALHRLGQTRQTGRMPAYLLEQEDPAVRRNAALVLGRLGEPGAVKVIALAMRDSDAGVRHHALEAMARLGNSEAQQELTFMANAGVGSEEVFAIQALAQTGERRYVDTFRYKLQTATHVETRLAAADGLGRLGVDDGFEVAMRALRRYRPRLGEPDDPPAGQLLRTRQLAAAALGAIGRADGLAALSELMEDPADPRVQISAASAVVKIIEANRPGALPFAAAAARKNR